MQKKIKFLLQINKKNAFSHFIVNIINENRIYILNKIWQFISSNKIF